MGIAFEDGVGGVYNEARSTCLWWNKRKRLNQLGAVQKTKEVKCAFAEPY